MSDKPLALKDLCRVVHVQEGYYFEYSLEVEAVEPVEGTRKSATTTQKAKIAGYAPTIHDAELAFDNAKTKLRDDLLGRRF